MARMMSNYIKIVTGKKIPIIWIIVLAPVIRQIYRFYIILNILAFFKFFRIIYIKKLNKKIIDSIVLKWIIIFKLQPNVYDKIDTIVYIFINYLLIINTFFSIKSINFTIELCKIHKIYKHTKINNLNKLLINEFMINIELENITIFGITITID